MGKKSSFGSWLDTLFYERRSRGPHNFFLQLQSSEMPKEAKEGRKAPFLPSPPPRSFAERPLPRSFPHST